LIANNKTVSQIEEFTTADSLGYLSIEGLRRAVDAETHFCSACFDQQYPIPLPEDSIQKALFEDGDEKDTSIE
jgi:amidophosphoribosyltransferase